METNEGKNTKNESKIIVIRKVTQEKLHLLKNG